MPAKTRATFRFDADQLAQLEQLAEEQGLDRSQILRSALEESLGKADSSATSLPWEWTFEDFERFCEGDDRIGWPGLTTPEFERFRLEPFTRFILGFVFSEGLVELLILIPKGNGKTMLLAALCVFHLLLTRNAQCFIAAADSEQADELYRASQHFVEGDDATSDLLGQHLYVRESTRRIRRHADQGFLRVLASDKTKQQGKRHSYNPTLVVIEELHAHDNDANYVALRSAAFKRKALVLCISTAGSDPDSTLGRLHKAFRELDKQGGTVLKHMAVDARGKAVAGKDGRLTIARSASGRSVMLEWACDPRADDLSDLRIVKKANPASQVTIDSLEDALEAPGLKASDFARYRANVWADAADAVFEAWEWDSRSDPMLELPAGEPVWLSVDQANKSDSAAVGTLWWAGDRRIGIKAQVWALKPTDPRRPDPPAHTLLDPKKHRKIGAARVRAYIRAVNERNPVEGVIYDPHLFSESAEMLEDEGFYMIEFAQQPARLCPASVGFYNAVTGRDQEDDEDVEIVHDGDPVLRAHVLAGAAKDHGETWRFSKAMSRKLIDALISAVMGVHTVKGEARQAAPFVEVIG